MKRGTENSLAQRIARLDDERKELIQARARKVKSRRRGQTTLEREQRILRGEVLEQRREAAWAADSALRDAELAVLDSTLTDALQRVAFGLVPLNVDASPEPR